MQEIDGFLYNATFHGNDSVLEIFSSLSEITFYLDPAGAESAGNALAQALTDNQVSGISNFIPGSFFETIIVGVPYDYYADSSANVFIRSYLAVLDPNSMTWSSEPITAPLGADGCIYSVVSFERAEVPIPSTLAIFVTALAISLPGGGRRRAW